MVLTVLSYTMVLVFMTLIMTRRLSAMVALILVPTLFAILGGFASEMGPMMLDGIRTITPTAVLLMFAILYFGVMIDAGLFDPLVRGIVRVVDGDPLKVVLGTAVLTLVVALDGDGATTYMVTVGALMPLYLRMRMSVLTMVCVIMLSTSVMNVLPWGGPAGRAASALGLDMGEIFLPMVPAVLGSAAGVLFVAYRLGLRERARVGRLAAPGAGAGAASGDGAGSGAGAGHEGVTREGVPRLEVPTLSTDELRRPRLLWVNFALTVALMVGLLTGVLPLPALFMIGFAIALMINYPSLEAQRERLAAHAGNALAVSGLIFAAGIFTGILSGTGMVEAMASSLVAIVPPAFGESMALVAGLLSIPGTFFISYDAFYFGVLPVIAEAGAQYGVDPVQIARASLIGAPVHALSPLTASTYLLVGLARVELGDFQRYALRWALLISVLMLTLLALSGAVVVTGAGG